MYMFSFSESVLLELYLVWNSVIKYLLCHASIYSKEYGDKFWRDPKAVSCCIPREARVIHRLRPEQGEGATRGIGCPIRAYILLFKLFNSFRSWQRLICRGRRLIS